jgi:nicotinamide-nucleotide adenylyltransferase
MKERKKLKRALNISRFQPFHNGHYSTIRRIRNDGYEEIILGVGSAEKSYRPNNPFTCSERIEMIHSVLKDEKLQHYFIVPIRDIDDYDLWVAHAVRLVPKFDAVYAGNPLTAELFRTAGYNVVEQERLSVSDFREKQPKTMNVTGTLIRGMIANGDESWKGMVPYQVYTKILEIDGVNRIKRLNSMLAE